MVDRHDFIGVIRAFFHRAHTPTQLFTLPVLIFAGLRSITPFLPPRLGQKIIQSVRPLFSGLLSPHGREHTLSQ